MVIPQQKVKLVFPSLCYEGKKKVSIYRLLVVKHAVNGTYVIARIVVSPAYSRKMVFCIKFEEGFCLFYAIVDPSLSIQPETQKFQ